MLILDTDHLTAMGYTSPIGERLIQRLGSSKEEIATTAISVDEQLSGLLAAIHQRREPAAQIEPYAELVERMEFLSSFLILPWDEDSVAHFQRLKEARIKGGTMDLKIASIAIAHDGTLLTRNTTDFGHIPGLRIANWLD